GTLFFLLRISEQQIFSIICAEKNKILLVLSTMHNSKTIDESTSLAKKPEIITFYNATKGAVDNMDRMTENYTVARRSNR
ncbi:piggyBac transposable element-derived protein 4-like, partial [Aphis craccivora]